MLFDVVIKAAELGLVEIVPLGSITPPLKGASVHSKVPHPVTSTCIC